MRVITTYPRGAAVQSMRPILIAPCAITRRHTSSCACWLLGWGCFCRVGVSCKCLDSSLFIRPRALVCPAHKLTLFFLFATLGLNSPSHHPLSLTPVAPMRRRTATCTSSTRARKSLSTRPGTAASSWARPRAACSSVTAPTVASRWCAGSCGRATATTSTLRSSVARGPSSRRRQMCVRAPLPLPEAPAITGMGQ
eukprot:363847-Chlamydomonas_euryale.AAC.12